MQKPLMSTAWLPITLLLAASPAQAESCEASYAATTQTLVVPCVRVDAPEGKQSWFSAWLQESGAGRFSLQGGYEQVLSEAPVSQVLVTSSPYPVATVFYSTGGCQSEYDPASSVTVDVASRTVNIVIKTRSIKAVEPVACTADIRFAARAFVLPLAYAAGADNTYTLKANGYKAMFSLTNPYL
jgi:hypothetical protein